MRYALLPLMIVLTGCDASHGATGVRIDPQTGLLPPPAHLSPSTLGTFGEAHDISDALGLVQTPFGVLAPDGFLDLAPDFWPRGLNDRFAAGYVNPGSPQTCPVAAMHGLPAGSVSLLELPSEFDGSVGEDVNASGAVVGYFGVRNAAPTCEFSSTMGAFWHEGAVQVLPPLPGDDASQAVAVNDRGQAVGSSFGPSGTRAVKWIDGVPHDLGSLGGTEARATDVNNQGQVVGFSGLLPGQNQSPLRAFLWELGAMRDLGTLGGNSFAQGINSRGVIVGSAAVDGETRAVIWYEGEMIQLEGLGGRITRANAVNQKGQIVGTAGTPDSDFTTMWELRPRR